MRKVRWPGKAGITIAVLVVVEGTLRLEMGNGATPPNQLHPPDGRCVGLQPGSATEYTGFLSRQKPVTLEVNRLGYRGAERPPAKPAGSERVVFVGDSYTYGQGVLEKESLPTQLEDDFVRDGNRVEVMNFGIPGENLDEYLDQYRYFASHWQHDLLLVGLVENDLDPPLCPLAERITRYRLFDWMFQHVYLYRLAFLAKYIVSVYASTYMAASQSLDPLEQHFRSELRSLKRLSAEHHVRLGLVFMDDKIGLLPHALISADCRVEGIPALFLRECAPHGIPTIPGDGHFNAEGERIAAQCVAEWVKQNRLLGPL